MIGDVVFTTPAVAALRAHFPTAQITYIVEPAAAPVVAGNPHLSRVLVAPRLPGIKGLLADLALGRQLARHRFDVAIDFHGGPRASLLTWLSRAPRRIGYEVQGRGWMYTERIRRPRELRARHSVENQWDLLAGLGVPPPSRVRFPIEMVADPSVALSVGERLGAHALPDTARLAVLHVSASNPFRRWPLDSFARVAAGLVQSDGQVHVIVTSGPSEVDAASRVIRDAQRDLAPEDRRRVLACGDFSLAELRALLDRASLFIGGDSGPMHVAGTTRVPIVSLYGPTLPARSEPWRDPAVPHASLETLGLPCRPCDQRRCEPGDFRCLNRISPDDVLQAAHALLGRSG